MVIPLMLAVLLPVSVLAAPSGEAELSAAELLLPEQPASVVTINAAVATSGTSFLLKFIVIPRLLVLIAFTSSLHFGL
ncbi:hypothetical protein D3C74_360080 [compost metagenome]